MNWLWPHSKAKSAAERALEQREMQLIAREDQIKAESRDLSEKAAALKAREDQLDWATSFAVYVRISWDWMWRRQENYSEGVLRGIGTEHGKRLSGKSENAGD